MTEESRELDALRDENGKLDPERFVWEKVMFSAGRMVLTDKLTGKVYRGAYF
jgi:hypothetical protein